MNDLATVLKDYKKPESPGTYMYFNLLDAAVKNVPGNKAKLIAQIKQRISKPMTVKEIQSIIQTITKEMANSQALHFDNIKEISGRFEGTLQSRPGLKFIMKKANESNDLMLVSDQSDRNPGNDYFRRVLQKLSSSYDVWVAYVEDSGKQSDENVHMMMTVTTTPNALLTSHMGIFKTPWSPEKGLSIPLHAFAAKVTLMRDPKKKYMVTPPLENMLKIMLAKLPPDSIFLGSRESFENIPEKKQKVMEEMKRELQKKGLPVPVDQKALEETLQTYWRFVKFHGDGNLTLKEYEDFSKTFHPLISRPRPFRKIIIFKESKPKEHWLEISQHDDNQNQVYGWLFDSLFDGIGSPETVVVNLEKLAALTGQ